MIAPLYALGLPVPTCEGRELTKRDVGRWVVRTRPNSANSDWSFTVKGTTIEDWKNQVVKVVSVKRARIQVEDKKGNVFLLDEEKSQDAGWLTLEEFIAKKVSYSVLPYSSFIKETKHLDASDVGKKFLRIANNGALDSNFVTLKFSLDKIEACAIKILSYKPGRIAVQYDGQKITLKDDFAQSGGWIELSAFQEAIRNQGIKGIA